jgi:DNA polymerase
MNQRLWLDFETRSMVDLGDVGIDRYGKDPSTKVLMLAWAFDDEEPELWQPHKTTMPQRLHEGLVNSNVEKWAWNYNFEKNIFQFVLGYDIPQEQWHDPSILCVYMSLPGKLERAAQALGVDVSVQKTHLIGKSNPKLTFSKPSKTLKRMLKANPEMGPTYFKDQTTHPEMWEVFCEYCLQDVRAERAVWYAATSLDSPVTAGEWDAWSLDQRMNRRGVWIDEPFVENAKFLAIEECNEIVAEIKTETGLENPNSQQQLLAWLQERGYNSNSIDKENVENALKGILHGSKKLSPLARKILELKQKLGGSSYKKLQSIQDRVGADGRLRDQFVYHGAHTGRWSGRGVQLQNLTKPDKNASLIGDAIVKGVRENTLDLNNIVAEYNAKVDEFNKTAPENKRKKHVKPITTMQAISSTIRAAFAASPGKKLVVGDLAQIESRVLAALAGCQPMINAYASGEDLYCSFMTWLLKREITKADSDERARGKIVILGCGFGMGVEKFIDYAASFGVELTQTEAKEAVYGFREKYAEITTYWNDLDRGVKKAVKLQNCNYVRGVVIDGRNPKMLKIKLPNGRYLHYLNPSVTIEERFGRMEEGVSYESWDSKGMRIKRLYGGLICENIVQAVARDLLLNGMLEAEKQGMPVIMTIHDEIVSEVDIDSPLDHHDLEKAMTTTPFWAEGMGFILAAEGWTGPYYRK